MVYVRIPTQLITHVISYKYAYLVIAEGIVDTKWSKFCYYFIQLKDLFEMLMQNSFTYLNFKEKICSIKIFLFYSIL